MNSRIENCTLFKTLIACVIASALLFLTGCATNPATGKRQIMLMSEDQEIALGREADPQIISEYGLYETDPLSSYVDSIGQKLASESHRPQLEWQFKVVDSPAVNAFALPGGYIYVTRGILAHFNSEAEMAAVLGHEIGHVTARHTASRMSKAQLVGVSLGVGGLLVPEFNRYSGLAQTSLGMLFLKFSRDDERQADDLGVVYAAKAGYDPQAFIEVFEMLEGVSEQSSRSPLPNWLSTHPSPENRSARIIDATENYRDQARTLNRDIYVTKLNGMVFGDDPKEGFMKDDTFIHPELAFALQFPSGWKIQNTKQFVLAVKPSEDAALKLTMTGKQENPETNARKVAEQAGYQIVQAKEERIHGNEAFIGLFEGQDQQTGAVHRSLNTFIQFRDTVYRIEGIPKGNDVSSYQAVFLKSMRSFRRLRSGEGTDAVPERIKIIRVDKRRTLREFIEKYSTGSAKPETVAFLNDKSLDALVNPGDLIKVVVKGR
ncbi:M48 family metalloprotease [Acidobacteriota bacterium]